jgi:hypothetical protein
MTTPHDPHRFDTIEEKVGTHPLAGVAGALGGAAAGAMVGIAAGPVGSLLGAVGGAVLGGVLGVSGNSGPLIDTSVEQTYWRQHYASRPYVPVGAAWSDYEPAYQYGVRHYVQQDRAREWSEVETELGRGWDEARGESTLAWDEAKEAARDAWDRMRNRPADADERHPVVE